MHCEDVTALARVGFWDHHIEMRQLAGLLWAVVTTCLLQNVRGVVELDAGNFTSYLAGFDGEAPFSIEFYAHWCPHCRHFAPTYEQVAGFFEKQQEAAVQVAHVDCADPVRPKPTDDSAAASPIHA